MGSDYEQLIMLDDDISFQCIDPIGFMSTIDNNPNGYSQVIPTLRFFTISKSIYKPIDVPDVDVEKHEGYGDLIFLAQCKAQYPDSSYDLSQYIKEDRVDYLDKIPSTWASEQQYDWSYLTVITELLVKAVRHTTLAIDTSSEPIDIVLPYVDSTDPLWLDDYANVSHTGGAGATRFRSWGTLKYLFRGIAAYMPFIRNVVLILARESQIPDWLDTNYVRIVYHKDFIPEEYLPVFNSCTIETFLSSIPDLSERFIYFNDDIFPINPMTSGDFFTGNIPHLIFTEHSILFKQYSYLKQCRNSLDLITNYLGINEYDAEELLVPEHTAFPMVKSVVDDVYNHCKDKLCSTVTTFRDTKNVNQIMYQYYHYFTNTYIDDICPYMYIEVSGNLKHIEYLVLQSNFSLLCLNDCGVEDYDKVQAELLSIFETKFPDKCKYEISNR